MPMQRTAKVFMNNRSQAVRLPKEFQFSTSEVFIRRQGDEVVLSPRPQDWSAYFASDAVASEEFMEGVEDLPVQERSL
jgi:antitoxin VapB